MDIKLTVTEDVLAEAIRLFAHIHFNMPAETPVKVSIGTEGVTAIITKEDSHASQDEI